VSAPDGLPPGPPAPKLVQVFRWLRRPIPFLEQCARRYGDTFTFRFPANPPIVIFSHPDAVKEIFTASPDDLRAGEANVVVEPLLGKNSLLLLDGERHRRERRLLTPPFRGERMQAYGDVMREITDRAIDAWPIGRPFPIHPEMQGITMDIILRTVFGLDEGPRLSALRRRLIRLLTIGANPMYLIPFLRIRFGPLTAWSEIARLMAEVDDEILGEIARRRDTSRAGRTDVLSMLLDARDEQGQPMGDQELRDQMMTLLVAGHETTGTALSWTIHRLLRHPEVLARAREEISVVAGEGPVMKEHLPRLEYLDAAIMETMRLNPIIPFVARRVSRPVRIGGWDLPEGVIAGACIYLAQRRADAWKDPERFDPRRFLEERVNPYAYFPFGGGTRLCLGAAFASYEMKIVLAQILRRVALRAAPGHSVRVVRRSITLAPSGGVPVVVDSRAA
jgi:cytochrome P450